MQMDLFADEEPIGYLVENKIQPVIWDKNWLPFTNYKGAAMLILDFNVGKNGTDGQVFTYFSGMDSEADETVISDSFEAFSQNLLSALQQKQYEIVEDVIVLDYFV